MKRPIYAVFAAIAIVAVAAVYGMVGTAGNAADRKITPAQYQAVVAGAAPYLKGTVQSFAVHRARRPVTDALIHVDGMGEGPGTLTLGHKEGRLILVNFWATWCGPCRREMPALDRLQAAMGGEDFEVVAINLDRGGIDKARDFLDEIGVEHLALYTDPSNTTARQMGAFGLPITVLIGPDGQEIGRLTGPAEWDAPEAMALIRYFKDRLIAPEQTREAEEAETGERAS